MQPLDPLSNLLGLGDALAQDSMTSAREDRGMQSEFLYATYIGPGSGAGLSDIEILGEEHLDIPRLKTPSFDVDIPAGQYMGTSYYTSDGTFAKADFAGLGFVIVEAVGAGGGGGGGATTAGTTTSTGSGGGGGGYCRKVIQVGDLGTSESVAVGTGGPGGAAGNNDGTAGGNSTFGTHITAGGGGAGNGSAASTGSNANAGGTAGTATGGDLNIPGASGGVGRRHDGHWALGGRGAGSFLAPNGVDSGSGGSFSGEGQAGFAYGGGGSGGFCPPSTGPRGGGAGAAGIVMVHRYAADTTESMPGGFTEGETLLCLRNQMIPLLIIGAITGTT